MLPLVDAMMLTGLLNLHFCAYFSFAERGSIDQHRECARGAGDFGFAVVRLPEATNS
jgi:hypothetical protein